MTDEVVYQESDISPRTYHVQVRLWRSGPAKKRDGRRGDIILEDVTAPPEVARWLASPTCTRGNKSTLKGATVDIWVDGEAVGDTSIDIPDADAVDDSPAPPALSLPPEAGNFKMWEALSRQAEIQHQKDVSRYEAIIKGYEQEIDDLATRALEAKEQSDARIAKILASESKLLELVDLRMVRLHDELGRQSERRSAAMTALDRDSQVFEDLREKLSSVENKSILDTALEVVKDKESLGNILEAVGAIRAVIKGEINMPDL